MRGRAKRTRLLPFPAAPATREPGGPAATPPQHTHTHTDSGHSTVHGTAPSVPAAHAGWRKASVHGGPPLPAAMDTEALDELAGQLRGEALGGRGLLQLATATGLAAYAVWAAVLMPGFRRVPLHLQVPPGPPPCPRHPPSFALQS